MSDPEHPIGSGPSARVSLSLPEGTAEAVRAITGKREFSAYIAEAAEHRLRAELIAQDIADYQEQYGSFSDQERAWARHALSGQGDSSGSSDHGAAT
ncbi:hypothetical protein [Nocardiopsis rhodophaea]|uniref:hypothetical protein n=1 Tax=Nocardiopsis rhodophaea TaxID=280238 RepID=UPI0031DF2FBB